ncbi:MAG: OsmC family protein [Promethearchaeota archaeon]
MSEKLLNDGIIAAYTKRLENMNKYKFTEKGDELYISTLVAEVEQIKDLHVKSNIGDISIECDAPKDLGGSGNYSTAMKLLLASLANCLEISGLLYFTFANVKINSLKVKVEGTYDKRAVLNNKQAPLPGFYNYKITWYIDSDEKLKKIQQVLKKVERNCPVRGSLDRPHEFSEELVIVNKNE